MSYNDYGSGFYCTQDFELAKEWACKTQDDGFVNIYELDICDLKILDLSSNEYNVLHWIAILLKNRKFTIKDPIEISAYNYILDNFIGCPHHEGTQFYIFVTPVIFFYKSQLM